jgi:hypothetical protein
MKRNQNSSIVSKPGITYSMIPKSMDILSNLVNGSAARAVRASPVQPEATLEIRREIV